MIERGKVAGIYPVLHFGSNGAEFGETGIFHFGGRRVAGYKGWNRGVTPLRG